MPAHPAPGRDIGFSVLKAASAEMAKGLSRGTLVVYETTISVRRTRRSLIPVLEKHSGLKTGEVMS